MSSTRDQSSGPAPPVRRAPRQARAAQRVLLILEAAASVIAEVGYEAATLTQIAARANTSIGALYQYFPDKRAVAGALAASFGRKISERWEGLETASVGTNLEPLVDRMLSVIIGFLDDFPAFLPLLSAADGYRHDAQERDRLRGHIAALFIAYQPALDQKGAVRVAGVVVEIIKSMGRALEGQTPQQREALTAEFGLVLRSYLDARLGERRDPRVGVAGATDR